jgi:hypothetical protein
MLFLYQPTNVLSTGAFPASFTYLSPTGSPQPVRAVCLRGRDTTPRHRISQGERRRQPVHAVLTLAKGGLCMAEPQKRGPDDDVEGYFYSTRITLRNGRILYAHEVGLKAFRIPIRRKKKRSDKQR